MSDKSSDDQSESTVRHSGPPRNSASKGKKPSASGSSTGSGDADKRGSKDSNRGSLRSEDGDKRGSRRDSEEKRGSKRSDASGSHRRSSDNRGSGSFRGSRDVDEDDDDLEHDNDEYDDDQFDDDVESGEGGSVGGSLSAGTGDLRGSNLGMVRPSAQIIPRSTLVDRDSDEDMDEEIAPIEEVKKESASAEAGQNKKKEMITSLWPEFEDKFRPADVERIVETVVKDHLEGQPYDGEEMPKLIKVLTDAVQAKIKALKYKRYKIITHVALGERRGEGVVAVTRCIWDPMSDCLATYTFMNETVFCSVTVYGVYSY